VQRVRKKLVKRMISIPHHSKKGRQEKDGSVEVLQEDRTKAFASLSILDQEILSMFFRTRVDVESAVQCFTILSRIKIRLCLSSAQKAGGVT